MCIHCDPGVDCAHDRETDTWPPPPKDRPRPATETRRETDDAYPPALTVFGFTAALRALGRDGGER